MFNEIVQLEQKCNTLLPTHFRDHPSPELREGIAMWAEHVWQTAKQMPPVVLSQQQQEEGLQLCHRPVFICGVHRSGTTLLRDILDDHSQLSVLPSEGSFLISFVPRMKKIPVADHEMFVCTEWLKRIANPINKPPYWLLGHSTAMQSFYVEFARMFSAWWKIVKEVKTGNRFWQHMVVAMAYTYLRRSSIEQKEFFWVDKTPTNEQFMSQLWKSFPEAKIIHILRHPVAVLKSRKLIEPNTDSRYFIKDMEQSFNIARKMLSKNDSRYHLLTYENVCNSTRSVVNKLVSFIGIGYEDVLLRPTVAGIPAAANSSFSGNTIPGKILDDKEHAGRQEITDEEAKILKKKLGKTAGFFEYNL